jgi:cytochrome c oxidase cbb3-type subunit 3
MVFASAAGRDYGCRRRGRVNGRPVANSGSRLDSNAGGVRARRRRWRRWGWKTWTGLGLALALGAVGAEYLVAQATLRARLMRADPGAIVQDAALRDFAISYARPAYDRHCAACHGAQMQGDPGKGAPNLTDQDWLYGEGRVAQIEHVILYGIRSGNPKGWNLADMPAFARPSPYARYQMTPLEPGDIRDVIEFLMVTADKPGDRAAAERGARIFADKGQCFDCHSTDAQGDAAIGAPDLVDDIWLYGTGTRQDLYDSIARGRSGICPAWFGQLSPVTIRALAVMIHAASHKAVAQDSALSPAPSSGQGG